MMWQEKLERSKYFHKRTDRSGIPSGRVFKETDRERVQLLGQSLSDLSRRQIEDLENRR